MLNPNMFTKNSYKNQTNNQPLPAKNIQLQKIGGFDRTRWDEPIEVPQILYQKFKVPPPANSKSASSNQVNNNNYPPSLIDFIRRAYLKCKDPSQKKLMEKQIKQIVDKNKNNINQVNWDNYPIPNIISSNTSSQAIRSPQPYLSSGSMLMGGIGSVGMVPKTIQRQMITIPSSITNRSILDKAQKPSKQQQMKAKQLLNQRLQSFQQRHEKMEAERQVVPSGPTQQRTYIGFKDQKQVKLQMLKQKYEQMGEKKKLEIQHQKKPEPPKMQYDTSNSLNQNFNNAKEPAKKLSQPLQVIESSIPQKVYQVKKLPQSLLKKQQQTKTPKITKKQLQTIVKSGQTQDLMVVAKRYAQFNKTKAVKHIQVQEQVEQQDIDYKIVGKCKTIDKPYLRITHRPDPQTVRPQSILRKAFNHYKALYHKGQPYDLIISQFRSIRQDLTVQDIRNSFTVQVYEQNLRMSVFQDDPIQMKQCQTNLWQLYRQGLYNKRTDRVKFISYHFICMILQQRYKQLEYMLTLIPTDVLQQKQIQQSLKLKRHLVLGNYFAFFKFHMGQDQTCQKIMEHYMDKIRLKCLVMACKTFGQKISFKLLGENVGQDQDILKVLAVDQGAKIQEETLILKQSYQTLRNSEHLKVKKVTSLLD